MRTLEKRMDKLEATESNLSNVVLFLEPMEGESDEAAMARISAGTPAEANIIWVSFAKPEVKHG
jgi:hypothetical protein